MKKILTSFLLMAMITGCVQQGPTEAEKPEEPPVVEQPEKPVEQEKPEETEIIQVETFELTVPEQEVQDLLGLESFVIQTPYIEKAGSDYALFNEQMEKNKEKYFNSIRYDEKSKYLIESYFVTVQHFQNDEILSLLIKEIHMGYGAGRGAPTYTSYSFDLNSDTKISQLDLLGQFNLTTNSAKSIMESKLQEQGYNCCPLPENAVYEEYVDCYEEDYLEGYSNNYSVNLDDNSVMYVNNDGELIVVLKIGTQTIPYYVEIQLS